MAEKWSSETTIKYIQEFKCYECLWNTKSPTYKLKHMREASWQKVVDAMNIQGFGVPEAKKKMRNLRSTYYQEKGKIQKSKASGAGSDDVYVPHVKWFIEMDSLLKIVDERRETSDNVNAVAQRADCDHLSYKENDEPSTSTVVTDKDKDTKKKHISKKSGVFQAISELKILQELVNKNDSTDTPESNNQFDVFGRSVAAQLKCMPVERAALAQSAIQTILSDHTIAYLRGVPSRIYKETNTDYSSEDISIIGANSPIETPKLNDDLLSEAISISFTDTSDTELFN